MIGIEHAAAREMPGDVVSTECTFEGYDLGLTKLTGEALGFVCGYVVVPERHANPDGATIRIPFAVHRATGTEARPDPLVIAQGGPGADAFKIFTLLTPNTEVATYRDIIIFNQRGTPYAEPELSCPETDEALPEMLAATGEEADEIFNHAIDACYARLESEGIDLSAYNSLENAADVPVLVRALGYEEYNFYGVSYGSLLGLHLMHNHPDGLRSVILDSVVTPDINFISTVAESENRVLKEIFSWCEVDAQCSAQYPNLEERFFEMIRQYDDSPVNLTLTDPETGRKYDTYLDGVGLRSIIFQLLYQPGMNAVLPKLVADLEHGDTRYIETMWPLIAFDQIVAEGMYYSVICAEDADIDLDAIPLDSLYPHIASTVRDKLQTYIDRCARWQVDQLPSSVDDPVVSDIPTLLLSGRFDPITPPASAEAAAVGLSNSITVVDPIGSHGGTFLSACTPGIVADFLDDPTTKPDTSCLLGQAAPTVVPPNAVTVPLMADINSLNARTLIFFGLAAFFLLVVLSPFLIWPVVYIIRAFGEGQPARTPEDRRVRLFSRISLLVFAILAIVFVVGFLGFVIYTIAADPALLTAFAFPPSAAPVLWVPTFLLLLSLFIVIAAVMLWRQTGSGSQAGKVYYSIVALASVAFVVTLATQGLLLPPL